MPYLQKHPTYKWVVALGDYTSLNAAFVVSILILGASEIHPVNLDRTSMLLLCLFFAAYSLVPLTFFQMLGLYHIQAIAKVRNSFVPLVLSGALSLWGLFLIVSSFTVAVQVSKFFAIFLFITSCVLLIFLRIVCLLVIRNSNLIADRVIIIGAGTKGMSMLEGLSVGLPVKKAVGFIDDNVVTGQLVAGIPVLGKIFESHAIARKKKVDFFIMAIDNIPRDNFYAILKYFNDHNLTIYINSGYLSVLQRNLKADTFSNYRLIRIGQPLQSPLLKISKRLFDFVASLIAILVFSPALLLISLLVKISSPGPVIYKQTRIGKNGRPFTFYKFRSMRMNSDRDVGRNEKVVQFIKGEHDGSASTKIVNASQITAVGAVLRKSSLDELPQLFNVLKGDMSLVGPRPCLPMEWDVYESWQKQRLMFMPGCTGLWQVSGRSKVNFEETVLMDLYYNCNVSLWLDLKILLYTIPVMIFSKGGE